MAARDDREWSNAENAGHGEAVSARAAVSARSAEAEIKRLRTELLRMARFASASLLGASILHEIKNPLTAVVGLAQAARRELEPDPEVAECLQLIEQEGHNAREVVRTYLSFVREDPISVETRRLISVGEITHDVGRLLARHLQLQRVRLEIDTEPDLPLIEGHAAGLRQVLVNLVLNSQEAMPNGGHVCVRTRATADEIEIEVEDDGPGIPLDLRDRVFDPLFSTKPASTNSGLGLYLSAEIIQRGGGHLLLDAQTKHGTTFRIRLPRTLGAE